jgi:ATP-dependent Clp protease ATP-binding subunit ClpC
VGARVHLKNIHVPKHIVQLEEEIEVTKELKNQAVRDQEYEKAANFRDKESKLIRQLGTVHVWNGKKSPKLKDSP